MLRVFAVLFLSLCLASCAAKPPVQAMAEARAAVQSVRPLYQSDEAKQSVSYKYYQSAEQALLEASQALDDKKYAKAKKKAKQAKMKARMAARIKE
jgi:pectin methylesterase-like acyl-CoA thioesterase